MKKALTSVLAVVLILSMLFTLTACGDPKKQEVIDKLNDVGAVFNETAVQINENKDYISEEVIAEFQAMSLVLNTYSELLSSGQEIPEENLDAMSEWLDTAKEWCELASADIDVMLAE